MSDTMQLMVSKFRRRPYWSHVPGVPYKDYAPWVWLYVFSSLDLVKVGITRNVKARLTDLRYYSAAEIFESGRAKVRADVASIAEFRSHVALEAHHVRGEWFSCGADAAIAVIRRETRLVNRIDENWTRSGRRPQDWPGAGMGHTILYMDHRSKNDQRSYFEEHRWHNVVAQRNLTPEAKP